ncbi:MAG TPA: short chain dehydrogenase, partial [Thermoleophilia bacterium]|nr:short chain dehydrogenase [Thermoleophilia bacterium]
HALTGFFGSLRNELAHTGVTVTVVCLPWVHTGVSTRALTVHGRPHGALSRHERGAMSSRAAAALIVEAAARRRRMAVTPLGRLGLWLAPFAPRLVDAMVRHQTD